MKLYIYLFILMTSSSLYAQVERSHCLSQISRQSKVKLIDTECFKYAELESARNLQFKDDQLHILGWMGAIFIKSKQLNKGEEVEEISIVSGKNTHLKDIAFLTYNHFKKEIYVLNKAQGENEILVFKLDRNGDIKPRVIGSDLLFNAKAIALKNSDELLILNDDSVQLVSTNSNSRSKLAKNAPHFKLILENNRLRDCTQIHYNSGRIMALDFPNQKILVFSEISSNLEQEISILQKNDESSHYFQYDSSTKKITVFSESSDFQISLD